MCPLTVANFHIFISKNNHRSLCRTGYFLQGLYSSNNNNNLHNIEEGHYCKPNNLANSYLRCYDHDVSKSFDNKGLSKCDSDHYVAGVYRGGCDKLYRIEKFKCCMMHDGCKIANWGKLSTKKAGSNAIHPNYITGLLMSNTWGKTIRSS